MHRNGRNLRRLRINDFIRRFWVCKRMRFLRRAEPESNEVYVELVAAAFTMLVPAAIMSVIFLAVGTFCALEIGGTLPWIAVAGGLAASASRLGVILAYRRQPSVERPTRRGTAVWEFRLGIATLSFAASVALLGVACFVGSEPVSQMLSTSVLFGFCSGAVARGYVRPRICAASVTLAAVPIAATAALAGGIGLLMLASMFLAFLAGSLETIRFAYRRTREQIALRNEMSLVARHDALTGLVNRFGLREAFGDIIRSRGEEPMVAVHCLDLDRFKPVNDCFGHPAGDSLLRELAARILKSVRAGDVAARLGGDEFVVVQTGIERVEEAEMFARRLCRLMSAPYHVDGQPIEIGVSLGYATSPPFGVSLDTLIEAADATLYRVKRAGGGVGSSTPFPTSTPWEAVGW